MNGAFGMRDGTGSVRVAIAAVGCAAIVSQIVFMRELLIVFYGNELSTAFMLAAWLTAGAIGSALVGRFASRVTGKRAAFSVVLLAAAAALPASLWAIRSVKGALGLNPGEIVAFFPMAAASFAVLAPVCILTGFLFALSCAITAEDRAGKGAGAGMVYALESAGAMVGGAAASFLLVRYLSSVQIITCASALLLAAALLMARSPSLRRTLPGRAMPLLILAALAIHVYACASGAWDRFDRSTLRRQWRGYELVASRNSIYGNVAVTRDRSQYSFFANGLHLYTVPDRQFCEESVHFALLEHPAPGRVLIIGGGAAGLAAEALKHPVERVDYVELDPLIVRMAEKHLPREYVAPLRDPRVRILFDDGRRYLAGISGLYDAIIVALGDPYTAQLNRFYTAEFFAASRRAMRPGGILSFALTGSESYLSRDARAFLGSIRATLGIEFAHCKIVPGEAVTFLASAGDGVFSRGYRTIVERSAARGLDLRYVREYYLSSRLSEENVATVDNAVGEGKGAVNRDFRPISYYYDMVFWAARFKGSVFAGLLRSMNSTIVWAVGALLAAAIMAIGGAGKVRERKNGTALASIAVNGFSQISIQIVILLAFQIVYGYMYYKLGLIITACMAGLALGSWAGVRLASGEQRRRRFLAAAQMTLAVLAAVMPAVFLSTRGAGSGVASWICANIVFTLLPLACGACGGMIFSAASGIGVEGDREAGAGGGLAYGLDLLGSCAGALLAGTLFIPVLGIPNTCYMVAALNIVAVSTQYGAGRPGTKTEGMAR